MKFGAFVDWITKFGRCRAGNFASIFAVAMPVLLGITGGGVDLMVYNHQKSEMQNAADAAVLAVTREASLKSRSQSEAESAARSYVEGELTEAGIATNAKFSVVTLVDNVKHKVTITVDMDQYRYFLLGYFQKSPQIRVMAAAQLSSETPVCMIALEGAAASAIELGGSANVIADGCASYSNSLASDGILAANTTQLTTAFTCTAGGFKGQSSRFSPVPTTDCPPLADPLAARPQPVVGACDYNNVVYKKGAVTINPGVYCGGIDISNKATVTMNPGVYIINGGEFGVKNNGTLTGNGVTIFFTGADGRMLFDGTTTVNLIAPSTGPTAGILLFQDRAMGQTQFELSSKSAANLLGTVYLPNGIFFVAAPGKIAESSAFTVIVAKSIKVSGTAKMYLNSNYGSTTVPVPAGLGPSKTINLVN